jgi:hypothetical protein
MSSIRQIQLRYEAHEDRALLRLNTTDPSEFRFWVTRRYAQLLWSALTRAADETTRGAVPVDAAMREAMVAFEHQAALGRADFASEFRDEATAAHPLGELPVLLAQVRCAPLDDGFTLLGMHPLRGQGVEVRLDATLLHSLLKLLADAADAGQWGLELRLPGTDATPGARAN